jgi:hypothetical protein
MSEKRLGKAVNGFMLKEKKRNDQIEGVQSLNNKQTYVFLYDDKVNDFVGKWIDTPSFVQKSIKAQ